MAAELGVVIGPDLQLPDDSGLDYVEPTVVGRFLEVGDQGESKPAPQPLAGLRDLPVRGAAVLFPGHLRLADPAADPEATSRHLAAVADTLGAVAEPGAWVVLGSGAARRVPDDVPREAGLARLAEVVAEAHDVLGRAGLEVLVEPLRSQESNVFTTIDETVDFLDAHGLERVRFVFDTYHLHSEGRTVDDALRHLDRIGHVHLADIDRHPVTHGEWPVLDDAVAVLEAGYTGRFSFECRWTQWPDDLRASAAAARARLA